MRVSSHVLSSASGEPVVGLPVTLSRQRDGLWEVLVRTRTDELGRIRALEPADGSALGPGDYRLIFDCGGHLPESALYPEVIVSVRLDDPGRGYHVPLVLSPFGYTTYLGSAG